MVQQTGYQFVMIPQQLSSCLDANCHKMLSTLLGLNSLLANEDGWFYRSNKDLQLDARLSENVIRATLDTLYQAGIINIDCIGKGRGHRTNRIHINFESFKFYQKYSFNDIRNNPDLWIETVKYKDHFVPSYMKCEKVSTSIENSEEICESKCERLCECICEKVSTNTDTTDISYTINTKEYNIINNKEDICEKVSTIQELPTCKIDIIKEETLEEKKDSFNIESSKIKLNDDLRYKGYECCKDFVNRYQNLDYQLLVNNSQQFLLNNDIKMSMLSGTITSFTGVSFSKNVTTQLLKDYVVQEAS